MHDLTAFQRDLLYVIAGTDTTNGLAIRDALEDYYGAEVLLPQLSPDLETLIEKGLVEKDDRDGRTNSYALTQRGHRAIETRDEWEAQYVSA